MFISYQVSFVVLIMACKWKFSHTQTHDISFISNDQRINRKSRYIIRRSIKTAIYYNNKQILRTRTLFQQIHYVTKSEWYYEYRESSLVIRCHALSCNLTTLIYHAYGELLAMDYFHVVFGSICACCMLWWSQIMHIHIWIYQFHRRPGPFVCML